MDQFHQHIEFIKREFPHAKEAFTSARSPKMQELIKKLGFIEDKTYVPNKELISDFDTGFVGYKKVLE
jgi:hypothetical protein